MDPVSLYACAIFVKIAMRMKKWSSNVQLVKGKYYLHFLNFPLKNKLTASFPIFKDNKLKDMAGGGNLISLDPTWSSWSDLNCFFPIWFGLIQFDPIWSNFVKVNLIYIIHFDLIWTNLNHFEPTWSNLNQFYLIWSNFNQVYPNYQSDSSWSFLIRFEPIWSNLIWFFPIWANFIWFEQNYQSDPIWKNLKQFYLIWTFKSETNKQNMTNALKLKQASFA